MQIFDKSTFLHLRFPFSFFLMPVFLFAVSQSDFADNESIYNAILVFVSLHLFIYPSSNGYNSYQDKDVESIGGLKNPPPTTKNLLYFSIVMDVIGLAVFYYVNFESFLLVLAYVIVSRLYSYRKVRIKRFAILGFLSVIVFQGFIVFLAVYESINQQSVVDILNSSLLFPAIASSFMIAGTYPLTQIYQHKQDREDGVSTISMLLGYRGTFVFSGVMYLVAGVLLFLYFTNVEFIIFQFFLFPVGIYFLRWFFKVWNNELEASFENTMRMNVIASSCMNLCFLLLIIIDQMA